MSGDWQDWVGRSETREDVITSGGLARFKATLNIGADANSDTDTAIVPDGFHWCLCLPDIATEALGADGHPPLGGFMPPLPFPRRMWAASDVEFLAPLRPDMAVQRRSTIEAITPKSGQSGDMVFVTLVHETRSGENVHMRERQSIVYRDHPSAPTPLPSVSDAPPPGAWDWHERIVPDAPLLFRYSALMFNTHRIHYDLPYAQEVEGYPGLVVHGPLTASLLLKLCATKLGDNRLKQFSYRAKAPLYADQMLHLCGRLQGDALTLAAFGADGREAISATACL